MMNRVSKKVVASVLKDFFTADMAARIYHEICEASEKEAKDELGMKFGDWKRRFDDDFDVVWAADTGAGFGNAGDTPSGDIDDCRIVKIVTDGRKKVLHVWDDALRDLKDAKKPFLIKSEDGIEVRGSYASMSDAIYDAKSRGFEKFECFRWEGVSAKGKDMWAFAFRVGKED